MNYSNKLPGFNGLFNPQSGGNDKLTGTRSLEMARLAGFEDMEINPKGKNKVKEDSDAIEFIEKEIRKQPF